MRPSAFPADIAGIEELLTRLPEPDPAAAEAARRHQVSLTKPPGSLGRLEELAEWMSAVQGGHPPRLERAGIFVFAGNHGVVGRGVSAYPADFLHALRQAVIAGETLRDLLGSGLQGGAFRLHGDVPLVPEESISAQGQHCEPRHVLFPSP